MASNNDLLMIMSVLFGETEAVDSDKLCGMLGRFGTQASKKLEAALKKTDINTLPKSGKDATDRLADEMSDAFGLGKKDGAATSCLHNDEVSDLEKNPKAFESWMQSVEAWVDSEMPPHIDCLPTPIVNWLKENFMFT